MFQSVDFGIAGNALIRVGQIRADRPDRALAPAIANRRISVNAVAPGFIQNADDGGDLRRRSAKWHDASTPCRKAACRVARSW